MEAWLRTIRQQEMVYCVLEGKGEGEGKGRDRDEREITYRGRFRHEGVHRIAKRVVNDRTRPFRIGLAKKHVER